MRNKTTKYSFWLPLSRSLKISLTYAAVSFLLLLLFFVVTCKAGRHFRDDSIMLSISTVANLTGKFHGN